MVTSYDWSRSTRTTTPPTGPDVASAATAGSYSRTHRRQVHRQERSRFGQVVHANDRSRGTVLLHHLNVRAIHLLEIPHVLEKDVHVDHVIQVRPHGLEHDPEGLENPLRLRERVRPASSPDAGSTPAVPPMVIQDPTFAM